ncbi:hypothetical protein [Celeribacter ethanolicus]|uniref:hypothetical protein n=1 Tax=Celeribacter ethanolicus TaxID=1758178 RepID=UPI0018E08093|nr:hypothetical protein [Celeribacter ethanolicus]
MSAIIKNVRYDERAYEYQLIRDAIAGERAVKAQGQLYTKKSDGMTSANYEHYLERGSFYGAPEMTLRALVGLALRKDPVIALPERLEPMRLNATHEKAPLSVLIEDTVREVMALGRYGLLLEFPREGNGALTTPYFSTWRAEEITDWDTAYVNGRKELTRVVLASDEKFDGSDARSLRAERTLWSTSVTTMLACSASPTTRPALQIVQSGMQWRRRPWHERRPACSLRATGRQALRDECDHHAQRRD